MAPINGSWKDVVNVPQGRVGRGTDADGDELFVEVKHKTRPPGHREPTASMRTSLLGGHEKEVLTFEDETRWHTLSYDGGVWMTDTPIEQAQIDAHLKDFRGRVLIGGLGLGYAVNKLVRDDEFKSAEPGLWVDEIVVVEKDPGIVQLVADSLPGIPWGRDRDRSEVWVRVATRDLFEYLRSSADSEGESRTLFHEHHDYAFDSAFFDIWQSDGEGTAHGTVMPLVRLAYENRWVHPRNVVSWNQDIMLGQLFNALHHRALVAFELVPEALRTAFMNGSGAPDDEFWVTPQGSLWHDWYVPFFMDADAMDRDAFKNPEVLKRMIAQYVTAYLLRPDEFDEMYEPLPDTVQRLWKEPHESSVL